MSRKRKPKESTGARRRSNVTKLFSLEGRVALVTGASRGLGRSMALALAGCGAHVVVNGRNAAGIEATRAAIVATGGGATAMPLDTTEEIGRASCRGAACVAWGP